jgi:hypothetical protein
MTLQRFVAVFACAAVMSGSALLAQRHIAASVSFDVPDPAFASRGGQHTPVGGQSEPVMHVKGFGGFTDPVGTQSFVPTMVVEVMVTRLSTDAERDRFVATGIPGLRGMPVVGQLTVAGHPAYAVYYAERTQLGDGGQALKLITDYVAGLGRQKVAAPFPVTVVSLMLDAKGHGSGFLGGARQISYDPAARRIVSASEDPNQLLLHVLRPVAAEREVRNDHPRSVRQPFNYP